MGIARLIGTGKLANTSLLLFPFSIRLAQCYNLSVLGNEFPELISEGLTSLSSTNGVPNLANFALPLLLLTFFAVVILGDNCAVRSKCILPLLLIV